ncbi:MAG: TRAP transporter large permease [Rhizobiales bacterium]|nr:TRAP transporter large permease [Hyphomicrobiales bacterium]
MWLSLPVAFFLGVPIALVLGLGATLFITVSGTVPLSIVAQRAYAGIDNPSFLAIPAFMLTGALMLVTGMSDGLVVFASAVVGRFRGGLALADVLASVLFADISGSAVADTAAIGATLMPGMVKRGYDRDFVAAHQAAAGSLGTLFPPSISMIIFATVTSVSVTGLFLGSIVPGLLVAASYMMIAYLVARYRNYPREPGVGLPDLGKCFIQALPALVAPVVVLGVRAFVDSPKTAAMVLFIIANASILAWVLVGQQVPQEAALFVSSLTHHPVMIMLLVSVLLIALSIFLEPPAILITVVPVLLPVVTEAGVSDLQFGVIVMLTGAIGMLLPPIGITLLVSVSIIQSSIERAARAAIPYVLVACADLGLVILFPTLTSWLPKFLGH